MKLTYSKLLILTATASKMLERT